MKQKRYLLFFPFLIFFVISIAVVWKYGLFDYYDKFGSRESKIKWILPPTYYQGTDFSEGRAWVQEKEDGLWTLFDEKGHIIKDKFEARAIRNYQDGLAGYAKRDTSSGKLIGGILDKSGITVSSTNHFELFTYGDGLSEASGENGNYGYIDIFTGEWVIPPAFEFCDDFSEGLAAVRKEGKWGYIDKEGNNVTEFIFDKAYSLSNGIAVVSINSKYGLINKDGSLIAEPLYDQYYAYDFSKWSEPIGMQKDDKVGFIDSKGNVVIDFKFRSSPNHGFVSPDRKRFIRSILYAFNSGRAVTLPNADDDAKYNIIDTSGKRIFTLPMDTKIPPAFMHGFLVYENNEGISLWNVDGLRFPLSPDIIPPAKIFPSENGIFRVVFQENLHEQKTGYFELLNSQGGNENGN